MYKLIGSSEISAGIHEYVADTLDDLAKIPPCEMGSTALVLENKELYIRNGEGKWEVM